MPSVAEFLGLLWAGVEEDAFIELRVPTGDGKATQKFFRHPDGAGKLVDSAMPYSGKKNVYFGVGLRSRESGKADDVLAITTLWCDIDFSKTPKDAAVAALRKFPLRPTVGVLTGGGIHAYWFLREPMFGDDLKEVRPAN